ncbi:MAG: AAA family ATPase [Elainellaceae cyanobacterium]
MPRLILLIGLPASGKSTLAQCLIREGIGQYLISSDAIREQLFGGEAVQGPWNLVWGEIQRQFRDAIEQINQNPGQAGTAIYDATNAVRRNRRNAIDLARTVGFSRVVALWLDSSVERCLERNRARSRHVPDEVIWKMYRRLQAAPPSLSEKIDCLIHYPSLDIKPFNIPFSLISETTP